VTNWLPRTLFSRLVLVLLAGLVLAQAAGLAIYWRDRDEFMQRAFGMRSVQRLADIIHVLDDTSAEERKRIIGILNSPQLRISADVPPLSSHEGAADEALFFSAALRRTLGDDRPMVVRIAEAPFIKGPPPGYGPGKGMMGGAFGAGPGAGGFPFAAVSFVVQVTLRDGALITLDSRQPKDAQTWPYRLIASLAIILAAVVVVALIAVRGVTRPLNTLASAAEQLGENIDRPPLEERGPMEVKRAARAFNTMQQRIRDLMSERTRMFAAISHDLKTPITRLRLRAELLDDDTLRTKFENDLGEIEQMVSEALDLVRGLERQEPMEPIDVIALVQSVRDDIAAGGARVDVQESDVRPYVGRPKSLRRCLLNLVENAVKYGHSAVIAVTDEPDELVISVCDSGPGIPEAELARVMEPFYRLEQSRNRQTGGTGLGLAIARNIAIAHGGKIELSNRMGGGLQALLTLPRGHRREDTSRGPRAEAGRVEKPSVA